MNERTWFHEDAAEQPLGDERTEESRLWTRRSALALTAGFLALGVSTPARAAFVQQATPRANHIVVSKTNRVLALMDGATTLKRYKVHLGFAPEGHKQRSGDGRTPQGPPAFLSDGGGPMTALILLGLSLVDIFWFLWR